MPNLIILSRDADSYADLLTNADLTDLHLLGFDRDALPVEALSQADILLADPDLAVPHLNKLPNLTWLQSTWAGVTPFIVHDRRGYRLTGVKDVFGRQMREYVLGYMLFYAREMAQLQELKQNRLWSAPQTTNLYNKTVVILGVGSIGRDVAQAAKAFDMKVIGMSQTQRDCPYVDHYITRNELQEVADSADFLVNLLPSTPQTENLINAELLHAMPEHSVVINAGRGEVIDDQALLKALQDGQIRGAVLDVFRDEPLPQNNPLWSAPNVQITQHSAAISRPGDIAEIFIRNYTLYLSGADLVYSVDFDKGY